jgi:hypothetical protein
MFSQPQKLYRDRELIIKFVACSHCLNPIPLVPFPLKGEGEEIRRGASLLLNNSQEEKRANKEEGLAPL